MSSASKPFALYVNQASILPISGKTYAAYDDRRIWGVGKNRMEARQAARKKLHIFHGESDLTHRTSMLDVVPMTDRLRGAFELHGEAVAYVLLDNGHLDVNGTKVEDA
jgi:hypothetical protein